MTKILALQKTWVLLYLNWMIINPAIQVALIYPVVDVLSSSPAPGFDMLSQYYPHIAKDIFDLKPLFNIL